MYYRMRNIYIILIVIIIYVITLVYNKSNEITPEMAKNNIKYGKYDYIVDVRTKKEWDEDHLKNTINIPIGDFVSELPKRIPDKNTRILFICKKGIRASAVIVIAHKLGYKNVESMIGNYKELRGTHTINN